MDGVLLRKCVVEFIGTFFLVFVIGCVFSQAHVLLAPLAIGATLMVMIFAGGHISGAHYNPAVTLGIWISGACNGLEAAFYVVAQLIGAVAASIAVPILFGHTITAITTGSPLQVVLAEFLGTFALVYTVLNVATAPATAGNSFYGLAIGFTVFVQAVAIGSVSGGAFNPAVALGASVLGAVKAHSILIYWLSELFAAAAAAGIFRFLVLQDRAAKQEATHSRTVEAI
jgi:Glycerol uptake facilitator and related permeases (Major Intrinsic Protein Family)